MHDKIDNVIANVINDIDTKIGLRWCDKDDVDNILIEYTLLTLQVHDILCDEIVKIIKEKEKNNIFI